MSVTRWFRGAVQGWALLGFLMLATWPGVVTQGLGHPRLPAAVHAITLGALLTGYYALQNELLARRYGHPPPWPGLAWAVWGLHLAGVAAMVGGFLGAGFQVAYAGAHYLVPAGVLLHAGQAAAAAWRRPRGVPRQAHLHLPLLGLIAAMALGALIILDPATGRYGLYTPRILLVHGLTGAMLFLLPALWLHGQPISAPPSASPGAWAAWGGAGLALAAVATGRPWPVATGLAALGAGCLGFGLPVPRQPDWAWLRTPWLVPGLFLLYAAGRSAAGWPPGEALGLAKSGGTALLLVAAVPGMMTLLRRQAHGQKAPPMAIGLALALVLAGSVVAVGGALDSALGVRAGAGAGAVAALCHGWPPRGAKTTLLARTRDAG